MPACALLLWNCFFSDDEQSESYVLNILAANSEIVEINFFKRLTAAALYFKAYWLVNVQLYYIRDVSHVAASIFQEPFNYICIIYGLLSRHIVNSQKNLLDQITLVLKD